MIMMRRLFLGVIFFIILGFSIAQAAEIRLTTIMPSGDILRAKKGAVGTHYITQGDAKYKADDQMDDGWLYLEHGIAIGDRANDATNWWNGPGTGGSLSIGYLLDIEGAGPKLVGDMGIGSTAIKDWEHFDCLDIMRNIWFDTNDNPFYKSNGVGARLIMGRTPGRPLPGPYPNEGAFYFDVVPKGLKNQPATLTNVMSLRSKRIDMLSTDGVYWNGTTKIAGPSDIRLKKDITTIPDALERLGLIRGVNFRWKDNNNDTSLHTGTIAQEVEKAFPELVRADKDGIKSVLEMELTGVLIEAVKDLKKENDELKDQNKGLEDRVSRLEKKLALP